MQPLMHVTVYTVPKVAVLLVSSCFKEGKMNKQFFIQKAGSINKLSAILGINRQAITKWKDQIPEGRIWQLRVLRPEWFDEFELENRRQNKISVSEAIEI